MPISLLELRHIIESGFLPLECRCTEASPNVLTIEIIDRITGANLVVSGIDAATLGTCRAISDLVGDLRRNFEAKAPQPASFSIKTAR